MTCDGCDLYIQFIKRKPLFFMGTNYDDVYAFTVSFFEFLHKMNIVKRLIIEFMIYQFQRDEKYDDSLMLSVDY